MSRYYKILDKNKNVIDANIKEWGEFLADKKDKIVEQTELEDKWVSTVFLGIDHGFGENHLWFETMVFPLKEGTRFYTDMYCDRYETYQEAKQGHAEVVKGLKAGTLNLYGEQQ